MYAPRLIYGPNEGEAATRRHGTWDIPEFHLQAVKCLRPSLLVQHLQAAPALDPRNQVASAAISAIGRRGGSGYQLSSKSVAFTGVFGSQVSPNVMQKSAYVMMFSVPENGWVGHQALRYSLRCRRRPGDSPYQMTSACYPTGSDRRA